MLYGFFPEPAFDTSAIAELGSIVVIRGTRETEQYPWIGEVMSVTPRNVKLAWFEGRYGGVWQKSKQFVGCRYDSIPRKYIVGVIKNWNKKYLPQDMITKIREAYDMYKG